MKAGNIFLIILTSIITFIGLCFNKLYDKFVKKNVVVQCAIYLVFTLGILRLLYWISKPFLKGIYATLKGLFTHVHLTITLEPSISLTVVGFIMMIVMINIVRGYIKEIK